MWLFGEKRSKCFPCSEALGFWRGCKEQVLACSGVWCMPEWSAFECALPTAVRWCCGCLDVCHAALLPRCCRPADSCMLLIVTVVSGTCRCCACSATVSSMMVLSMHVMHAACTLYQSNIIHAAWRGHACTTHVSAFLLYLLSVALVWSAEFLSVHCGDDGPVGVVEFHDSTHGMASILQIGPGWAPAVQPWA